MGKSGEAGKVNTLMVSLGYVPRELFNKLNMGKRLLYHGGHNQIRVDVFMGEFLMCHKFDFGDHVDAPGLTLPITDLVITKLQVIETTDKEYRDLSAAFTDHAITNDETGINGKRVARLCAKDWGVWKTFTQNLSRLGSTTDGIRRERIERLQSMIMAEPKNLSWKLRAKVGEKKKWYQEPEAV